MIGQTISDYTIVEKLGEGAMGIVYKAQDTRLGRLVALKFLSGDVSARETDHGRLLEEAKAAATLNHPNVCTIYDIREDGGRQFIIMEFIEGQTLASRRGTISSAQTIDIGIQMARALAHAHRRGIVHSDVKTDNIMLTAEGEIKIMDFGIARLRGGASALRAGAIAGTAAYMSPEQTRGEEIDYRSDLFSFGVVLFELLAGRLPFRGEHEAALSYSVLNEDPVPLTSLKPDVPTSLARIIARCLEKDPSKRFQSAEEIVSELRAAQRELAGASRIAPAPQRSTLRQLTFADAVEEYPAWSPDGTRVVFCREIRGYSKLVIRDLSNGREDQLTRGPVDDIQPSWSPEGKSILFVRSHQADGNIEPRDIFSLYEGGDVWRYDLDTAKEYKVIDNAFNPSFSPDGTWIAIDASWAGPRRIWLVDNRGRNPRQITSDISEAVVHIAPKWSPTGSTIVFQNVERVKFDVRIVDLNTGKMDWVTDDTVQDVFPVWSRSGTEILLSSFRSGGLNIWSIPVGHGIGGARQLTVGAGQDIQAAVSPDGSSLIYSNIRLNADIWRLPVARESGIPAGAAEPLIVGTREESRGAWSPDGTMVALNSDRSGDMNIWIFSLQDGSLRQLTHGEGGDFQPNWSPDGNRLSFFSARSGRPDIWIVERTTGEMRQLTSDAALKINPFFSPDGAYIAYQCDAAGRLEPWVMKADGSQQRRLSQMEVSGHFMRWSNDGKSVIFRSPNPSRPGLWSAPLKQDNPVFLCVPKGGAHISFSPDHTFIMDVVDHKELWVTPLKGGEPRPVFRFEDPQVRIDYPVWSPDGKWILFDRVRPQGGNIWMMENYV